MLLIECLWLSYGPMGVLFWRAGVGRIGRLHCDKGLINSSLRLESCLQRHPGYASTGGFEPPVSKKTIQAGSPPVGLNYSVSDWYCLYLLYVWFWYSCFEVLKYRQTQALWTIQIFIFMLMLYWLLTYSSIYSIVCIYSYISISLSLPRYRWWNEMRWGFALNWHWRFSLATIMSLVLCIAIFYLYFLRFFFLYISFCVCLLGFCDIGTLHWWLDLSFTHL